VGSWQKGYVFGLEASSGAKVWTFHVYRDVISSPVVTDGMVYVGDDNDVFHAFAVRPRGAST
jgi:outer membrane protein assembly factor BamB